MGYWFHKYPGTNFHEQNIDWIIESIGALKEEFKDFKIVNQIRYVGAWDITKQYGVYNVVTDNDIGYIAIQPVPASIAITNTDYWVPIADFYPQIADLGTRVSALEASDTRINNLLHNRFTKNFTGRNFLFIGDSYTDGYDPDEADDTVPVKYYEALTSYVNPDNIYHASQGGTGFGTVGNNFLSVFSTWASNNPTLLTTLTDVFILGGYNDVVISTATVAAAITSTLSAIKSACPNAVIYVGFIGRAPINDNSSYASIWNIEKMIGVYKETTAAAKCTIIDSEFMLHNYSDFSSDGVHPNQYGHYDLAKYLGEYLMSGTWDFGPRDWSEVNFDRTTAITTNNSIGSSTDISGWLYNKISKSGVSLEFKAKTFSLSPAPSSVVLDGSTANAISFGYIVGSTTRNFFSSMKSEAFQGVNVQVIARASDDNGTIVPGRLELQNNGELILKMRHIPGNAWTFTTLTDITTLIIDGGTITIPLNIC